jgi:hypothetical protein
VQRKDKGPPIEPPTTIDELQKNVEVTLALIALLCGENDLYLKLFDLYVVLNAKYTTAVKGTIFEEMRDVFNKHCYFPVSCMNEVANRIKYAECLYQRILRTARKVCVRQ